VWLTPVRRREAAGGVLSGLRVVPITDPEALSRSSDAGDAHAGRGDVPRLREGALITELGECEFADCEADVCIDVCETTSSVDIYRRNLMARGCASSSSTSRRRASIRCLNGDQGLAMRTAAAVLDSRSCSA
jgi:hypothetical protein